MDIEDGLALALELTDIADAITVAHFRAADLVVETKPDLTPVSEADHAVERALREHLARTCAGTRRARRGVRHEVNEGADFRWVIDPIDGTKSYVRGVPVWATLVALEHLGVPVVGAVSAPALGTRWWAGRGLGAFRDGSPISVSRRARSSATRRSRSRGTRRSGSTPTASATACSTSRTAAGACAASATSGSTCSWPRARSTSRSIPIVSYWDAAALVPIIEEAGGHWSTIDRRSARACRESFVCTNGLLHDAVIGALEPPAPPAP